jgi:hypothetical protein
MTVLADSNVGSSITVINDKSGNLLIKLTREYGEKAPTAEVLAVEQGILDMAKSLFSTLEK